MNIISQATDWIKGIEEEADDWTNEERMKLRD